MNKNKWLTATKVLIWVMFGFAFLGLGILSAKMGSMRLFLDIGSLILLTLFVLSLFLHFKPKKRILSFMLGFILADLFLRILSMINYYGAAMRQGIPLAYFSASLFWLIYEVVLLWVAYKAYKTFVTPQ